MKKTIVLVLTVALLSAIICSSAAAETNSSQIELTHEEIVAVQQSMSVRNIWGENFCVEVVYDANDEPSYLFGLTNNGYIILSRETLSFCEGGRGNPYRQYADAKKYYGGPFAYYVDEVDENGNAAFLNLMRKEISSNVTVIDRVNDDSDLAKMAAPESVQADTRFTLNKSREYIQRKAFGANYDGGDYEDTCSAVATGIALTYLAYTYDEQIVPDERRAEDFNDKIPGNETDVKTYFPKAFALQKYIVDDCGMEAASFSAGVSNAFNKYMGLVCPDVGLSMHSTPLPKESTIKEHLDQNLPVLITTTLHSTYKFHTMCVYGYRILSGNMEILVHTGWYGCDQCYVGVYKGDSREYVQSEVWIDEDYASFGYYID